MPVVDTDRGISVTFLSGGETGVPREKSPVRTGDHKQSHVPTPEIMVKRILR